jgi:hypothetical protein
MSTLNELFTPRLPDYWTPAEALAVYEFLNDLADAVWNRLRSRPDRAAAQRARLRRYLPAGSVRLRRSHPVLSHQRRGVARRFPRASLDAPRPAKQSVQADTRARAFSRFTPLSNAIPPVSLMREQERYLLGINSGNWR